MMSSYRLSYNVFPTLSIIYLSGFSSALASRVCNQFRINLVDISVLKANKKK